MTDSEMHISMFANILPKVALYSFSAEKISTGLYIRSLNDMVVYYDQNSIKYNFLDANFLSGMENGPFDFYKQWNTKFIKTQEFKDIGGKPLEYLKEVIFLNRVPLINERYYHILFFSDKERESVTRRLLEMNTYYNKKYGNDSFRIDEINDSIEFEDIKKSYHMLEEKFAVKINIPYSGPQLTFLSKGYNKKLDEYSCILYINNSINSSKLDIIIPNFILDGRKFSETLDDILNMSPPPESFNGFCDSDKCMLMIVFSGLFKKVLPDMFKTLRLYFPEVDVSMYSLIV
ncbi:MAG: hypothetical protein ACP5MU_06765 [Thermoplasmata archaeon]